MKLNTLLFTVITVFSLSVAAADKHGGIAVEAGMYHLELVAKDKTLTFYVNDHDDKPIDAKAAKATANVFSGKDKGTITLAASGSNMMKGEIPFIIGPNAKIVVSFTLPGKKTEQARFSLGSKQEHKDHKH